jgi:choline dehydrogenase-like flavoprotein
MTMHHHPGNPKTRADWGKPTGRIFPHTQEVDFVVIGSGAAGGVVARELSRAGLTVVVLEQGPYYRERDFNHDELAVAQLEALTNNHADSPNTLRANASEEAVVQPTIRYGRMVGGSSNHYTANFWRFHEIDFIEATKRGTVAGTGFADWPITYADLEPYYTKVEWEVGVSGQAGVSPFDPPRSKGYPVPPLPIKPVGVLAEKAAKKLGYHAFPAPMAILSQEYNGRPACIQCGFCNGYGCEAKAKSSSLATMIPEAEKTGNCEIRPLSYVRKIEVNSKGRAIGVKYFNAKNQEVFQRAKAVFVCANGSETPRLLLNSASKLFPNGLANGSGKVGKYIMFNGSGNATGAFEHEINGYRGMVVTRVIHDLYELDPALGLTGGGGFDFRFATGPITFAMRGLPREAPRFGSEYKKLIAQYYTRSLQVSGHTTQLPVETNAVDLDPVLKDKWGVPALRMTFTEHPNDIALNTYFQKKSLELLDAAGAIRTWATPPRRSFPAVHLLGTCRMGNDPKESVVNKYHRAHDVPNLFMVDGSSFVTSGRGQPTMTIQALAFRAAEHAIRMAKAGDLKA